jgi:hypothetical protein
MMKMENNQGDECDAEDKDDDDEDDFNCLATKLLWSSDSSVGVATGYGFDVDQGVGVRVPIRSIIFFFPRLPDRL